MNFTLLIDNSPLFIENGKKSGINLKEIDYVVISHAHKDHTGGLGAFLEINSKAKVYISYNILDKKYYSLRHGEKRDISPDFSVLEKHKQRICWVNESKYITENVAVIAQIKTIYPTPKANNTLIIESQGQITADNFNHEIALTINSKKGIIVFSGCAHNGLLNTIESCANFTNNHIIKACIGGAHLPNKTDNSSYETDNEILTIAKQLKELYKDITLYTGHCTGKHAQELLKSILGKQVDFFYSGYSTEIK